MYRSRVITGPLSPKMLAIVRKVDAAEVEAFAAIRERAARDAERKRAARRAQAGRKPAMAKQPVPPPLPRA